MKGQSLLEIVITIGIAVVIVIALTSTVIKGMQSSQFAQNQAQATKFAQEGTERLRSFRENDTPIRIGADNYYWGINADDSIWDLTFNDASCGDCLFRFINCPGSLCQLSSITTLNQGEEMGSKKDFRRVIKITDFEGNLTQKRIESIVSWSDYAGPHESKVTTILSAY